MVLILNGNSEIGATMWREVGDFPPSSLVATFFRIIFLETQKKVLFLEAQPLPHPPSPFQCLGQ